MAALPVETEVATHPAGVAATKVASPETLREWRRGGSGDDEGGGAGDLEGDAKQYREVSAGGGDN